MIFSENYYNLIKTLPSSDINRKYNSKMVTLEDFMSLKPLNVKQRNELLEKYSKFGDNNAMTLLIEHNLKFVADIAKQYSKFGELEELISVGVIGLIKAINRYNPNTTQSFKTVSKKFILKEIYSFLNNLKENKKHICIGDGFGGILGAENEPVYSISFDEIEYMSAILDEKIDCGKLLKDIKEALTDIEYNILVFKFGLYGGNGLTYAELSNIFNLSKPIVHSYLAKCFRKIRKLKKVRCDFFDPCI